MTARAFRTTPKRVALISCLTVAGLTCGAVTAFGATNAWNRLHPVYEPATAKNVYTGNPGLCTDDGPIITCVGRDGYGMPLTAPNGDVSRGHTFDDLVNGLGHACALESGTVYCWGKNDVGQLGHDPERDNPDRRSQDPAPVEGLDGVTVTAVEVGWEDTYAVTDDGLLYQWGRTRIGKAPGAEEWTVVENTAATRFNAGDGKVVKVSAGMAAGCALFDDGNINCWGDGLAGTRGNGRKDSPADPTPVASHGAKWTDVTTDGMTAYGVDAKGELYAWGGTFVPAKVAGITGKVIELDQQSVRTDDGRIYWLGYESSTAAVEVAGLPHDDQIVKVVDGDYGGYALTESGAIYGWGAYDLWRATGPDTSGVQVDPRAQRVLTDTRIG